MACTPDVCLLIPYYEAGADLTASLDSVAQDDLQPDVCVVDDGSCKIPARAALADYRGSLPVHVIELPHNQGIEHALNAGLEYCVPRYPYIARLDCGDRNIGRRLADQYAFLQQRPDYALVGGWADYVDLAGKPLFVLRHPVDAGAIRRKIFLNAPFTHPAIMMRSSVLRDVGFYPVNYPAAEDLALFHKIVQKYPTANLPHAVIVCEVNPNGISSVMRKTQIRSRIRLILDNFDKSPVAVAGLVRGIVTYCLPRRITVLVNSVRDGLRRK